MVLQDLFHEGFVRSIISQLLKHIAVSKFISGRLISLQQREDQTNTKAFWILLGEVCSSAWRKQIHAQFLFFKHIFGEFTWPFLFLHKRVLLLPSSCFLVLSFRLPPEIGVNKTLNMHEKLHVVQRKYSRGGVWRIVICMDMHVYLSGALNY